MKLINFYMVLALTTNIIYSQQQFLLTNLRSSVSIKIENRIPAAGYFITDSIRLFLVTAKHVFLDTNNVLWNDYAEISSPPDSIYNDDLNIHRINLKMLMDEGKLRFRESRDVAILCVGGMRPDQKKVGFSKYFERKSGSNEILGIQQHETRLYKEVHVSNDVFVVCYPSALGIDDIPQFDTTRPLLRKGIIAGKNEIFKTIILDCPIYKGNSGSPVFQTLKKSGKTMVEVIGTVSQFVPFDEYYVNKKLSGPNIFFSNSGYSIIEPMDTVLELIKNYP